MRKNPLLILLNGPPRSGKDTAAIHLQEKHSCSLDRMSMPIKAAFHAAICPDEDTYDTYEASKELPIPLFSSRSLTSFRQWQIDFSEKFMKPLYGDDIFAKLFLERLLDYEAPFVVVPDCGFSIEAAVLYAELPPEDILLIQLSRPGCNFLKDSREYVRAPAGHITWQIQNDSSIESFLQKVDTVVAPWLEARKP